MSTTRTTIQLAGPHQIDNTTIRQALVGQDGKLLGPTGASRIAHRFTAAYLKKAMANGTIEVERARMATVLGGRHE